MKVLFYGETPVINTGAGRVSQHLVKTMLELGYDVDIVGINHFGNINYSPDEWPCRFFPARPYQFYNLLNAEEQIKRGDYDILFMTGDLQHMYDVMKIAVEVKKQRDFPIVMLGVVDADFEMGYLPTFRACTYSFVYSCFAQGVMKAQLPDVNVGCTPLGFEPEMFFPHPEEKRQELRKEKFGIEDPETFLVLSVNRNQYRKDIMRGAYAYHLFHQKYPNSKMYMHAAKADLGGHIPSMAHLMGIPMGEPGKEQELILAPDWYTCLNGVSDKDLNDIYNCGDVCISTSQGEGWGLTTSEAMSAGVPFIGPRHTTFIEQLGDERGYLVECGGPELWVIHYGQGEETRPVTSVVDMVSKLEHVYLNREEAKGKARAAREYAEQHSWKEFTDAWKNILRRVEAELYLQSTTSW